MSMTCPWFTVG